MALSSNTSNTVKRARELMTSRIDPMQLISQLANLIMDILAGKFQEGASEVKRQFFKRHTSEADLQQLNNALKILSETEKQLRTSKNQTTWLTVALLQLSSAGSSFNANDSSLCLRTIHPRDGSDHCSTSSPSESLKNIIPCQCGHKNGCKSERVNDKVTLESIWSRATEICKSISLRNFLRKKGKLASVCFHEGLAVVELEFQHPEYVSKAENSWKLIASALQAALGRNVEISIYNSDKGSRRNYPKFKKPSFSLFGCSRRIQKSTTPHENNLSDNINIALEQMKVQDNGGSHISRKCFHGKEEPVKTIRNSDGNALSVDILGQDPPKKSSCCPRGVKLHKKFRSSDNSQITSVTSERDENLVLSVPGITSSETCFCTGDPYVICNFWKNHTTCHGVESRQKKDSKVHCWRTPTFPLKKAWQLQPQRAHLMDWVLPCAKAK